MDCRFIFQFILDICKVWLWRIRKFPIVVVTTESGGLGDYLWIRSHYSVIKSQYQDKPCKIIVAGMKHWTQFALDLDRDTIDIYREFESCDNPRKSEKFFFSLFKADVFLDFRAINQKHLVRSNSFVFGEGCARNKTFYRQANNSTFTQWKPLPEGFEHRMPLLLIRTPFFPKEQPYVVLVEKGNTQGGFNDTQLKSMADLLLSKGLSIFYNGNYHHFLSLIEERYHPFVINGYNYPLSEYGSVVNGSTLVITVNTFIYHIAVQLNKPCVVISVNEYASIDLQKENQIIVFNPTLQVAYHENRLSQYQPEPGASVASIDVDVIIGAINKMLPC